MLGTVALLLFLPEATLACTNVIVSGPKGSGIGNTILDTNDCLDCDFRAAAVGRVAAAAPVRIQLTHDAYPREVSNRSPTYTAENLVLDVESGNLADIWSSDDWEKSLTLGYFDPLSVTAADFPGMVDPTVVGAETFASLEADYGTVNEASLAMGESTCACRSELNANSRPTLLEQPTTSGDQPAAGGALWDIGALTRLALARCSTARCALDLMGHVAVRDGYYGDPSEVTTIP